MVEFVTQQVLGMGLKGLPRDQIFVTTKCGRYGEEFDFSAERVKSSLKESLRLLQLDYLDLVHCHDIEFVGLTQVTAPAYLWDIEYPIPMVLDLDLGFSFFFLCH